MTSPDLWSASQCVLVSYDFFKILQALNASPDDMRCPHRDPRLLGVQCLIQDLKRLTLDGLLETLDFVNVLSQLGFRELAFGFQRLRERLILLPCADGLLRNSSNVRRCGGGPASRKVNNCDALFGLELLSFVAIHLRHRRRVALEDVLSTASTVAANGRNVYFYLSFHILTKLRIALRYM
jgi:hypothetical protein